MENTAKNEQTIVIQFPRMNKTSSVKCCRQYTASLHNSVRQCQNGRTDLGKEEC